MTIRELRWLLRLHSELNITRAAQALYISQSALSQCLQRCEAELGFTLFERSKRNIVPTASGQHFFNTAEKMLADYDSCLSDIRASAKAPLSQITIGVTPYINSLLSPNMARLRDAFPQIELRFYESNSVDLVQRFKDGIVDILSTNFQLDDPAYHMISLGIARLYIILRQGSPAADFAVDNGGEYPELDPIHLAHEPLATMADGSFCRQMSISILNQAGITPVFVQTVTRPTTLVRLAQTGVASSIYALSKEVRDTLASSHCEFEIPSSYADALAYRRLYCRKSSMLRFPAGFYTMLEELMRECLELA